MDCKVSIGIATLNGVSRVDSLLASIRRSETWHDHRIIVIDDGSTERNLTQLRALCAGHGVELREHRTNQGISTTWNHLAERFNAEYVVLLNDDVVVYRGWLDAIVHFLERNEGVGTVGLHPLRDGKIVVCGGGEMALDDQNATVPHRVVAANGYCFGFRRDRWNEVGRFDEEFWSFYEEVDFGVRLWRAGYQSFNIPWPAIEHEWSSTFQQNASLLPAVRMDLSKKRFESKWSCDLATMVGRLKEERQPPASLRWLAGGAEVTGGRVVEVCR